MTGRGWKYSSDGMLQRQGAGGRIVSCRAAGFAGRARAPWDSLYNPRTDAPAALMGATMIGPNRYRLGLWLLDANGAHRDEDKECPGCGCMPGDVYRMVKVEPYWPGSGPRPQAKYAPCPVCVLPRMSHNGVAPRQED